MLLIWYQWQWHSEDTQNWPFIVHSKTKRLETPSCCSASMHVDNNPLTFTWRIYEFWIRELTDILQSVKYTCICILYGREREPLLFSARLHLASSKKGVQSTWGGVGILTLLHTTEGFLDRSGAETRIFGDMHLRKAEDHPALMCLPAKPTKKQAQYQVSGADIKTAVDTKIAVSGHR